MINSKSCNDPAEGAQFFHRQHGVYRKLSLGHAVARSKHRALSDSLVVIAGIQDKLIVEDPDMIVSKSKHMDLKMMEFAPGAYIQFEACDYARKVDRGCGRVHQLSPTKSLMCLNSCQPEEESYSPSPFWSLPYHLGGYGKPCLGPSFCF
jgi:hypothetical protein